MRARLNKWLESLRYPVLLLIAATLFVADLFIPDVLPFVDEALLAILTVTLARLRRKPGRKAADGAEEDAAP